MTQRTTPPEQKSDKSSQPERKAEGGGHETSGSRGTSMRATLRYMSFDEGEAALSPDRPQSQAIAARGFSSGGQSVGGAAVQRMRTATGADVSQAREHTGPAAEEACGALGVKAYAMGNDVAYGSPNPAEHVRYHELAHVAQNAGGVHGYGAGRAELESNADAVATAVLGGAPANVVQAKGDLAFFTEAGPDITPDDDPGDDAALTDEEKARGDLVKTAAAKVKKLWRRYKRKPAVGELLGLLVGCDAATIPAILAEAGVSEEMPAILHCLATTDAGLKQPREAIAVIAACKPDVRAEAAEKAGKKAAEKAGKKAAQEGKEAPETPAELFYCAMTEAERATFVAEHPGAVDVSKAGQATRARKAAAREADDAAITKATAANDAKVAKASKAADAEQGVAKEKAATPEARGAAQEISEFVAMGGHELALDRLTQVPEGDFAGVIFTLDARSQVKELILGVGFETLWNRNAALASRILAARSPERNAGEALELLRLETVYTAASKKKDDKRKKKEAANGVADNILTPERAYTAFQLLKALPPAHRERFERLYPALLVTMHMSLNKSMREADDTNFFGTEAADQETIAAHLAKLDGDALWTEASPTELKMTLSVLLKGGQRDAVANRILYMGPAGLQALFEDDARRPAVQAALGTKADAPEGPATARLWRESLQLGERALNTERDTLNHSNDAFMSKDHGALAALHQGNKAQRDEAKVANKERREKKRNGEPVGERTKKNTLLKQAVSKKGIEIEHVPLDQLQHVVDMFGYGADVAFTDLGQRKDDKADETRNTADLSLNTNDGTMSFACDELMLDRLRFPTGGMTVETGAISMRGVHIDATFPTTHNPKQTQSFTVKADGIDIADIFVNWPGTIVGIDHVGTGCLEFTMEEAALSLDENTEMKDALKAVVENNPARNLLAAVFQFIGNVRGLNGAEKNAAGQLTQDFGSLADAFMNIPAGALGGVGLKVADLAIEGVIANADTYVDKGDVAMIAMVWDSRPTVVAKARLAQIERQREAAEQALKGVDASTKEGSIRQCQLEAQLAAMTEEVAAIGEQLPSWAALEAVWQEVYEAQLVHGAAAPDQEATLARVRGLATAAGVVGADAMELVEIGDVVRAQLRAGEGMVASVSDAKIEGAVVGGVAVGETGAKGTELAVIGSAMGTEIPTDVRQNLGGAGAADKAKTSHMKVTATVEEAYAKDVVYERGASVERLDKLQKKRDALIAKGAAKLLPTERAELAGIEKDWHEAVAGGPDGVKTWGDAVGAYLVMQQAHGDAIAADPALLAKSQRLEAIVASKPITVEEVKLSGASVKLDHTTSEVGDVTTTSDVMTGAIGVVAVSQDRAGDVVGKALDANATATTATTKTGEDTSSSVSTVEGDVCMGRVDAAGSYGKVGAEDVSASGSYSSTDTTKKGDGGKEEKTNEAWTASTMVSTGEVTYEDDKGRTGGAMNMMATAASGKDAKSEAHLEATGLHGSLGEVLGDKTKGMTLTTLTQQKDAITAKIATLDGKRGAKVEARCKELKAELAEVQKALDAAPGYEAAVAEVADLSKKISELKAAGDAAREAGDDAGVATNEAALVKANEALQAAQARVAVHAPSGVGMDGNMTMDKFVIDATGGEGGKLMSGDASGPVTLSVSAGPITLPAIDYFGSSLRVQMTGGSAATLTATANATFQKLPGHPNELIALEIEELSWPKVEAQGLLLTLPVGGELVEIGLPTAEMNGLKMSCVHLNGLSAEAIKEASGRVDVASVKATLGDKLPYGLKASGQLKLENLYADAVSSGDVKFGLGALDLEDLGIEKDSAVAAAKKKSPMLASILKRGGHVRHAGKFSLGGSYDRKKGTLSATVGLDDLAVSNIHYAGGGTKFDAGDAQISGVTVTVRTKIGADGLEYVHLDRLFVKRLAGTGIGYEGTTLVKDKWPDGSERIRTSTTAVGFDKGTLHDLDVRGLKGGGYQIDLEQGSVDGLRAHVKEDGFDVLQAHLDAQIDKLSVRMIEDDVTVDLDHGYVAGSIDMGDHGRDGTYKHVEFHGVGVDKTKVGVENVGKEDQTVAVHTKEADAYEVGFADGLAWNGSGRISALGEAHLRDINFYQGKEGTALTIGSGDATIKRWDYKTQGFMKGEDPKEPVAKTQGFMKGEDPKEPVAGENYGYTWAPGKDDPKPSTVVVTDDYKTHGGGTTPSPQSKPGDVQWKLDILRHLNGSVELVHPAGHTMVQLVLKSGRTGVNLAANARDSNVFGKAWNNAIAQNLVDYMEWVDFNIANMVEAAMSTESTIPAETPGPKRFETLGRILTDLYPKVLQTLFGQSINLSLADGLVGIGVNDLWQWGYDNELATEMTAQQGPEQTQDNGLIGQLGTGVPPSMRGPAPTQEQKNRAWMVTFAESFLGTRFVGSIGASGGISATDTGAKMLDAQANARVTLGGTLRDGLTTGVTAGVRDLTYVSGLTKAGVGTATVTANATTKMAQKWNKGVRREVEDAELSSTGDVKIEFTSLSFSMASAAGEDPDSAAVDAQKRLRGEKVPAKAATVGTIKRKE